MQYCVGFAHVGILEVINIACWGSCGGLVVKNLPSKAEDVGLIPDCGTEIPHAKRQLSP